MRAPSATALALMTLAVAAPAVPRPFWIIAHRCNDTTKVASALLRGANAIEVDIRYNYSRRVFVTNHDHARNPLRDDLVRYLRVVRGLAGRFPGLSLVIFDCKISDPRLSAPLLDVIRRELTSRVDLNVMLSVASYGSRGFFTPIVRSLRVREAVAVDEDDSPSRVSSYFTSRRARNHGYGNGTLAPGLSIRTTRSIMDAIALQARNGRIGFVYVWTLASRSSMRDYLRTGIDGIMVNDVSALRSVVFEREFRGVVRLGTRRDNPFHARPVPACVLGVRTGRGSGAGTDAHLRFTLRGTHGAMSTLIDAFPPGLFESGSLTEVTLRGVDIGTPQILWVSNDGSGNAPGWYLETITARKIGLPRSFRFAFDRWIDARRSAMRQVEEAVYRLVVRTGNRGGAGTDARVKFVLRGTRGILIQEVDGGGSRFERNRTDVVVLRGRDIGTVLNLSVSHDERGWGDDWYLRSVTAHRVGGPVSKLFWFNAWIEGRHPVTRG